MNKEFELKLQENGNATAFTKNKDYFEMSDGVFWTVDALMKKYDVGKSTLYNKARDNNIPTMKVLDVVCFKDDERFTKLDRRAINIKNLEGHKLTSYAALHRKIEELIKLNQNYPLELINSNTNDCFLKLDDVQFELKEIKIALNQILDHLTKDKKNDI